jgi:hypothetical protein
MAGVPGGAGGRTLIKLIKKLRMVVVMIANTNMNDTGFTSSSEFGTEK